MIKLKHLLKETIINEYGLPNIKDNPKRHAASELLTFLDWPTSFYEKVLKVKERRRPANDDEKVTRNPMVNRRNKI